MGNVKGRIAKNSFFLGLAKGYCNKIKALKKTHSDAITNALMVIEKKLIDVLTLSIGVYPPPKAMQDTARSHRRWVNKWGESSTSILPSINPHEIHRFF